MRSSLVPFFLFLFCTCFSQNEANIWYFGQNAGLDFNSGSPVSLTNGMLDTDEGCATICNASGQLLFYTDGVSVYNRNHTIMVNGTGLLGHDSSTQSATIVQKPGSTNLFYIFTIEVQEGTSGLRYSIVDMNLDSGFGAVTSDKNILIQNNVSEKFAVTKKNGTSSYWITTILPNSNQFKTFLLTSTGINPAITSNIGTPIGVYSQGYLKFSPRGDKLVMCDTSQGSNAQLYNFNNTTGILSNNITLTTNALYYGAEFSPNGELLYVGELNNSAIHQYNLNAANIPASIIDLNLNSTGIGALQLAPNGKIYIAHYDRDKLSVINNPNVIGVGAGIQDDAIDLQGKLSKLGLPAFNQAFFFDYKIVVYNAICINENVVFNTNFSNPLYTYSWDFGDGSPLSNMPNPTHQYNAIGEYDVFLSINSGEWIISKKVIIEPKPTANTINPSLTTSCDDEINPMTQNGMYPFDTSSFQSTILGSQIGMIVKYYDENNISLPSPLPNPFITGTQNIRVEVINPNNLNCFASSTIAFVVNPLPKINPNGNESVCNQSNVRKTLDASILDGTPTTDYTYIWKKDTDPLILGTNYTLDVFQVGTYTVEVTNSFNCSRTRTIDVVASDFPTITNVQVYDLSNNNIIVVSVSGTGNYAYSLNNIDFQTSNTFQNVPAGVYNIYVKDLNGCGTTPPYEVNVLGIPSYFTPNGDGYNDYWNIKGINTSIGANNQILIFDRLGKFIKQISPISQGWDGTYLGQNVPATDYWYSIQLQDGRTVKGHFALKR